jgi:phage-related protein (TIGR01555 family)
MIRFGGVLTASIERSRNLGFDFSVMQRVLQVLQETQSNWQSIVSLMSDFGQAVVKLANLIKILGQKGQDAVEERILTMDMRRSSSSTIVLDADKEDFERKSTPVAGAAELLDRTWQRLAAAAEMPLTILMGTSPAGLNATGESDMRIWYDRIKEHREKIIGPRLERLGRIIAASEGIGGVDSLGLVWPSLWQQTPGEESISRLNDAKADQIRIACKMVTPAEASLSRFGRGKYSAETSVDTAARETMAPMQLEQLMEPPTEEVPSATEDNTGADEEDPADKK